MKVYSNFDIILLMKQVIFAILGMLMTKFLWGNIHLQGNSEHNHDRYKL